MSPELVSRLKGYNCFSEDITERCNPYFFVIRAFASPAIVCILRAIVLHYRPKVIPQYAVHRCSFVKFYTMSTFRTEKENPIALEDHVEYLEKRHGVKYKDYLPSQWVSHKENILVFENKRIDSEPSAQRTPQQIGLAERSRGVMFEMPTDAIMLHVINDNYR